MPSIAELMVKVLGDTSDLDKKLKQTTSQLQQFGRQADQIGQGFANFGTRLTAAVSIPFAGVAVQALKLSSSLEQNTRAFTTMLGSAQRAQAQLDQLRAFAARTPFQFTELVDASKRLQALGFSASEVIPTLKAVGNAAAALGSGAEGINRITLALGQIKAKGTVQAEELRQLAEAGIPAFQILAKVLNTDVAGAMKLVEQRAVSASVAIPALLDGINQRFGGLLESQSQTLAGRFSNFKDQLEVIGTQIGKALEPVAKDLLTSLEGVAKQAELLIKQFSELPIPIQKTAIGIAGAAAASGPLLFAIGQISLGFSAVAKTAAGITSALGKAGVAGGLAAATTAALALVAAFDALRLTGRIAELVQLTGAVDALKDALEDLEARLPGTVKGWKELGRVTKEAIGNVEVNPAIIAVDGLKNALVAFGAATANLGKERRQQFKTMIDALSEMAATSKEKIDKQASEDVDKLRKRLVDVADAAEKVRERLQKAFADVGIQPRRFDELKESIGLVSREFVAGRLSADQFRQAILNFGTEVQKLDTKRVIELDTTPSQAALDALSARVIALPLTVSQAVAAMNVLGDSVTAALSKFDGERIGRFTAELLKIDAAAAQIQGAFATLGIKSQAELDKIAKEAKAAFETISDASGTFSRDAQRAFVAWIDAAIAAGQRLSPAILEQYERIKAATSTTTKSVTDKWKGFGQQVSTVVTDLSRGLARVITAGESLGKTFENIGRQIAESLIRYVIEQGIKQVLKALDGLFDKLGSLGKTISGIFGGRTPGFSGGLPFPTTGGGGGSIPVPGGVGGSIGGAASGASSGVLGIINTAFAGISAVTGVIGNFQNARQETTLNAIELNTRKTAIFLGEQSDSILANIKAYLPAAKELRDYWIGGAGGTLQLRMTSLIEDIKFAVEKRLASGSSGNVFNFYVSSETVAKEVAKQLKALGIAPA